MRARRIGPARSPGYEEVTACAGGPKRASRKHQVLRRRRRRRESDTAGRAARLPLPTRFETGRQEGRQAGRQARRQAGPNRPSRTRARPGPGSRRGFRRAGGGPPARGRGATEAQGDSGASETRDSDSAATSPDTVSPACAESPSLLLVLEGSAGPARGSGWMSARLTARECLEKSLGNIWVRSDARLAFCDNYFLLQSQRASGAD